MLALSSHSIITAYLSANSSKRDSKSFAETGGLSELYLDSLDNVLALGSFVERL